MIKDFDRILSEMIEDGDVTTMADKTAPVQYKRASEFITGLGESLDDIAGKDMLIHDYVIDRERAFGDGISTLVTLTLSTISDPEVQIKYHAWSEALADRLDEMNGNDVKLPVIIAFVKAKTRAGFMVWTIK